MFPQRLKEARKNKKLTQDELARRVNTKKSTISNYETGYSSPSHDMLLDLANTLDISLDYLLGRTDVIDTVIERPTSPKSIPNQDFHFFDTEGVQFIARSQKNLSPKAYQKMQELAKKARELFEEDKDDKD
ncbi:MAG: helix-turn-helix domain-containing protein [Candidatus Pristimantibacillus sp.]